MLVTSLLHPPPVTNSGDCANAALADKSGHPVQLAKASRRSDPLLDTWDASCEKMPAELVRLDDWDVYYERGPKPI